MQLVQNLIPLIGRLRTMMFRDWTMRFTDYALWVASVFNAPA